MFDKLQEIYGGMRERLKSPFIVTFIVIWSIRHWRLLFMIFSFDEDLTQGYKRSLIDAYIFRNGGIQGMVLIPVLLSFLSIVSYYIISLVYEAINIGYAKYGRPLVNMLDKGRIALKEDVEKEKKRIIALRSENESQDKLITSLNDQLTIKDNEIVNVGTKYAQLEGYNKSVNKRMEDYNALVNERDSLSGRLLSIERDLIDLKERYEEDADLKDDFEDWLQTTSPDLYNSYLKKLEEHEVDLVLAENNLSYRSLFQGKWRINYLNDPDGKKYNNITIIGTDFMKEDGSTYSIKNFKVDRTNRTINFMRISGDNNVQIFSLHIVNPNVYAGVFNNKGSNINVKIKFEKIG
jgi:hypothetical protein